MLVCLARCTFILHCSANATRQFVSRRRSSPLGEENKRLRESGGILHPVCAFESRFVRAGSSICRHFAGKLCVCVLGWGSRWISCIHFCLNRFHAAFVQERCKVDQSEKGFPLWGGSPALNRRALRSCIKRRRREGNVQRVKTSGLISGAVT